MGPQVFNLRCVALDVGMPREREAGIVSAESERCRDREIEGVLAAGVRDVVEVTFRRGIVQIDGRRDKLVCQSTDGTVNSRRT